MPKRILTVTLNPAIDKSVIIPDFKIGKDFRIISHYASAGGKGINVSKVLGRLKIENIATGILGAENGAFIKRLIKKEGIKSYFVECKNNTRHNITIINPDSIKITRILEPGPRVSRKNLHEFTELFKKLMQKSAYVTFSGRNIPGAPDTYYSKLIKIAKAQDKFTLLDTSGSPYKLGIKQKPTMIKPNLEEAEFLTDEKIYSLSGIKKALIKLHKKGIQIVIVSLGSKGGVAFNGVEMLLFKVPKIKRKNPVGCGDAFIAGFLGAHSKAKEFQECIRNAAAAGTANALSINPGDIKKSSVAKILKQVKITPINF